MITCGARIFPQRWKCISAHGEWISHYISTLLDSSEDAGFPPLTMNIVAELERWEGETDRKYAALVERLRGTRASVKLLLLHDRTAKYVVWADGDGYQREDVADGDVDRLLGLDDFGVLP